MNYKRQFIISFFLASISLKVTSQRIVETQNQSWIGYMTSTKINKQYSFWNDIQWVPNGFFLVRTGITKMLKPVNITVGYALGKLPVNAVNDNLQRTEHRPWFQVQSSFLLDKKLYLIPRFRYDGRFRQNIENGKPIHSFSFTSRIRFMATFRKMLTTDKTIIGKPFLSIGDELMFNFGNQISFNRFDQNRFFIFGGTQLNNLQIQIGYMNRLVNSGPNFFTQNNTMVVWVTQQFNWHKKDKKHVIELDGE